MKKLAIVILGSLILASCSLYKEVEVIEVMDFEIMDFSDDLVEIVVDIQVENPNGYKVKLADADIDILINGLDMGKLKLQEKIELPKKSVTTQKLKVLADFERIQESIMANAVTFLFTSKILVEATGELKGRALGFGKKVDVEYKEEVDISELDLGF